MPLASEDTMALQALRLILFVLAAATGLPQNETIRVSGSLQRVMAIGGESTGWVVALEKPIRAQGKEIKQVELAFADSATLEGLSGKVIEATGRLTRRAGVEIAERWILEATAVRGIPDDQQLVGTEWLLEDLAGRGVVDRVQATLTFLPDGRVAGSGSCNRFSGTMERKGDLIQLGRLVGTRRACPPAVMDQESKYMKALESAERLERQGPYLLLHCRGCEKPLRFTQKRSGDKAANVMQLFGRAWRVQPESKPSPPPGALYIFLENGTVLQTSCAETYRIARWTTDKSSPSVVRLIEDGREAAILSILEIQDGTVRLQLKATRSNDTRMLVLQGVEKELVCPDIRK
jgi:heat shock protein HslJ